MVEAIDEVHEACYFFVAYSDVAAGFIGNVHVVFLTYQALQCSAHGDDVIIGVGREHNHAFGIGRCALGTIGVIGIWLASRPTRNGVLQVVEYFNIRIVGRAIECEEFAQAILIVVLIR